MSRAVVTFFDNTANSGKYFLLDGIRVKLHHADPGQEGHFWVYYYGPVDNYKCRENFSTADRKVELLPEEVKPFKGPEYDPVIPNVVESLFFLHDPDRVSQFNVLKAEQIVHKEDDKDYDELVARLRFDQVA